MEIDSITNVGVSSVASFPGDGDGTSKSSLSLLAAAKHANENSFRKIVLWLLWASTLIAERKCLSLSHNSNERAA